MDDAVLVNLNGAGSGDERAWEPLSLLTAAGLQEDDPGVREKIMGALRWVRHLIGERAETAARDRGLGLPADPGKPGCRRHRRRDRRDRQTGGREQDPGVPGVQAAQGRRHLDPRRAAGHRHLDRRRRGADQPVHGGHRHAGPGLGKPPRGRRRERDPRHRRVQRRRGRVLPDLVHPGEEDPGPGPRVLHRQDRGPAAGDHQQARSRRPPGPGGRRGRPGDRSRRSPGAARERSPGAPGQGAGPERGPAAPRRSTPGGALPVVPGVPPEIVAGLVPVLAAGAHLASAVGQALGMSKSAAHRYLSAMREAGVAGDDRRRAGAIKWRLVPAPRPPLRNPSRTPPSRTSPRPSMTAWWMRPTSSGRSWSRSGRSPSGPRLTLLQAAEVTDSDHVCVPIVPRLNPFAPAFRPAAA